MIVDSLFFHTNSHLLLPFVILYIGPETILPLTSALAAIIGVLLTFWRHVVSLARRFWRFLTKKQS